MNFRTACAGIAMLWLHALASAAIVTHHYEHVAGSTWTVDLAIGNDGTPAQISGLTVYFSEALFSNLLLNSSPLTWDTLVIQPDLGIPAAGFLDTFLLDRSSALTIGQTQDGFTVQFDYLGTDVPRALTYDIVDENYDVLVSGETIQTVAGNVPEPATISLVLIAVSIVRLRRAGPLAGRYREKRRALVELTQ